jgi:succinoglycan biosynthesis transport protein ExoP
MTQSSTAERHTDEPTKPSGGISARVVWNAVRRHPVATLGVVLFAAAAAAGVWFFLPLPKKTAAVVFQVSSQPQSLLAPTSENRVDFNAYKQTQIALIKSRRTLNAALNSPQVEGLAILKDAEPDKLTWLDKHLLIDSKTGSEYIRVSIEGDNDEELLALLGGIQKAYLDASYQYEHGAKIDRDRELVKTLDRLKKELEVSYERIREVQISLGVPGSPDVYTPLDKLLFDSYVKASEEQNRTQIDFETAQAELTAAKVRLESITEAAHRTAVMSVAGTAWAVSLPNGGVSAAERFPSSAIDDYLRSDAELRDLEEKVSQASKALRQAEERFEADAAPVIKAKEELRTAEANRDSYRKDALAKVGVRLRERAAHDAEAGLALAQEKHDKAKVSHQRAEFNLLTVNERTARANLFKLELKQLRDDIAHKEKLARATADELERIRIELNASREIDKRRVTTHEPPFTVLGIEGNRRLKYTILVGLGAFLLGFGGLVGWEYRSRRVTRTEEVTSELGMRLIGTIPPLVQSAGEEAREDANSPLVEAIDTTRIMLTHCAADGTKLRVLMVTSAVSGEGKTTLSGHLAISLTRAGFRTLLIDGDMHAPSAHVLFDVPGTPGLSELLRGEANLADAVRATPIPGLSIMPAGRWTMSTRQSLVGDRWRQLKQELEGEFDFVVVDTSPLLMVSDAMLLAREADGVVVSVLLGVSQIARVAETVNRLQAIGAHLAGVVVNNVESGVYRRYMSRAKYPTPGAPAPADGADLSFAEEVEAEEMAAEVAGETAKG